MLKDDINIQWTGAQFKAARWHKNKIKLATAADLHNIQKNESIIRGLIFNDT